MRFAIPIAAFSLLLAGCGGTVVKTVCPPLTQYDRAFNLRLADEVDALPADSAVVQALVDYKRLRDIVRACGGA